MPLSQGKSKQAFSENVSREMHAGKPQKQSLAIAYSVQRKNKKKNKMADGGQAAPADSKSAAEQLAEGYNANTAYGAQKKASGGEINFHDEKRADADDARSLRDLNMLAAKKLASGGQIPLQRIDADSITEEEMDMIHKSRMEKSRQEQSAAEPDHSDADKPAPDGDDRAERMLRDKSDESLANNPSLAQSKMAKGGMAEKHEASIGERDDIFSFPRKKKAYGGEVEISFNDEKRANADDAADYEDEMMLDDHEIGNRPEDRPDHLPDDEDPHSLVEAVMHKRRRLYMGGSIEESDDMADMHGHSREEPNNEDDMSFNALRKENYSEDAALDALDQPEDSNMKSPEHEPEDEHDMIDSMRAKIRKKRGL